jgi:hypothetical protein
MKTFNFIKALQAISSLLLVGMSLPEAMAQVPQKQWNASIDDCFGYDMTVSQEDVTVVACVTTGNLQRQTTRLYAYSKAGNLIAQREIQGLVNPAAYSTRTEPAGLDVAANGDLHVAVETVNRLNEESAPDFGYVKTSDVLSLSLPDLAVRWRTELVGGIIDVTRDKQGQLYIFGVQHTDYLVTKMAGDGRQVWEARVAASDRPPSFNILDQKIVVTDSDSVYLGGEFELVKLDAQGELLWTYPYGVSELALVNGEEVIGSFHDQSSTYETHTARLSADGNVVWQSDRYGSHLVVDDGELTFLANAASGDDTDTAIELACLGKDGTTMWTQRIDSKGNDWPGDLTMDSQGFLYLTGASRSDDFFFPRSTTLTVKFDTTGKKIWTAEEKPGSQGIRIAVLEDSIVVATENGILRYDQSAVRNDDSAAYSECPWFWCRTF